MTTASGPTKLRFLTADVFTTQRFGGNPLGVFLDGSSLMPAQMQTIARELNLSETAFVLPPVDPTHTLLLRIFTPAMELPFAGHPTVGTAVVLAELGIIAKNGSVVFEEAAGAVPVRLEQHPHGITATLQSPKKPHRMDPGVGDIAIVAELLGLTPQDVPSPPLAYSAGVPFLFVAVKSQAALAAARVNLTQWNQRLAQTTTPHMFVYAMDDWRNGRHIYARMFAPAMGIPEDPATGGAAAALTALLCDLQGIRETTRWTIDQGREMGRPSRLSIRAVFAAGQLSTVEVGGSAVVVSDGTMFLD